MASAKDINGYCDFLFDELNDIKERVDNAIAKYGDFSAEQTDSEKLSSHLQDISNVIDAKMEIMGRSCDWKQFEGRSTAEGHVHPEGVPYGETPM